jgi:hypothetical protein
MKEFLVSDVRLDEVNVVEMDEKFMYSHVLAVVTFLLLFHFPIEFSIIYSVSSDRMRNSSSELKMTV